LKSCHPNTSKSDPALSPITIQLLVHSLSLYTSIDKMAPGATATASRGPSKLSKPAKVRYWKGKPLGAELDPEDSDEDESDEDGQESAVQKRKRLQAQQAAEREARIDKDVVAGGAGRVLRQGPAVKVDLKGVEVGKAVPVAAVKKEEEESSEEETDDVEEEEEVKPNVSIPKAPGEEVSTYRVRS
jgi:hypothetical protein